MGFIARLGRCLAHKVDKVDTGHPLIVGELNLARKVVKVANQAGQYQPSPWLHVRSHGVDDALCECWIKAVARRRAATVGVSIDRHYVGFSMREKKETWEGEGERERERERKKGEKGMGTISRLQARFEETIKMTLVVRRFAFTRQKLVTRGTSRIAIHLIYIPGYTIHVAGADCDALPIFRPEPTISG